MSPFFVDKKNLLCYTNLKEEYVMKVYEITVENTYIFYGYITENDIENGENNLSLYRKNKIADLKNINDKKLSALAELLLLYGMNKLGIKYSIPLEFGLNEQGKPFIKGMDGFFFNLSHSGDMAVCAISHNPVGVDVEKTTRDCTGIADRYFTDDEKEIGREKGGSYIWTRKEAVAKADGRGIGAGIARVDTSGDLVRVEDEEYRVFTNSVDGYYISLACRLVSP